MRVRFPTIRSTATAALAALVIACGGPPAQPDQPPDEQDPPEEVTVDAPPPDVEADEADDEEEDALVIIDGDLVRVGADEVPELLADCQRRADDSGSQPQVLFDCGRQIVSYFETPVTINHELVVDSLVGTPGFLVDVEDGELDIGGVPHPSSIVYHYDAEEEEVLVFAVFVVSQQLAGEGTRVITCSMAPEAEQADWCEEAVRAVAGIGTRAGS